MRTMKLASMLAVAGGLALATSACSDGIEVAEPTEAPADAMAAEVDAMAAEGCDAQPCAAEGCDAQPCAAADCSAEPCAAAD